MTPLRQRMIDDPRIRSYSPRTIENYVERVAAFAKHFNRPPEILGEEHIRQYQLLLLDTKRASWTMFNQTGCVLHFLYNSTLKRDWVVRHLRCPKQPNRLPVIPSPEEITEFLAAPKCLKHRAILSTLYATGIRLSEVRQLRVQDIDSKCMVVCVEQGKSADVSGMPRDARSATRGFIDVGTPDTILFVPGGLARTVTRSGASSTGRNNLERLPHRRHSHASQVRDQRATILRCPLPPLCPTGRRHLSRGERDRALARQ